MKSYYEQAEADTRDALEAAIGKVFKAGVVYPVGCLHERATVRVLPQQLAIYWEGGWSYSRWEVELVEPHRECDKAGPLWIYGPKYHTISGYGMPANLLPVPQSGVKESLIEQLYAALKKLVNLVEFAAQDDGGLRGDNWDEYEKEIKPLSDAALKEYENNLSTMELVEKQALEDYAAVVGKIFWVRDINGYSGTGKIHNLAALEHPILVVVEPTESKDILDWVGDWLKPTWNVRVLTSMSYEELVRCWIEGHQYNAETEEVQKTALVEALPPRELTQ